MTNGTARPHRWGGGGATHLGLPFFFAAFGIGAFRRGFKKTASQDKPRRWHQTCQKIA